MCGRYNFSRPWKLKQKCHTVDGYPMEPDYNAAPSQILPVITIGSDRNHHIVGMKWGLVPHWSKEPTVKFSTINARAESLETSPVYKAPLRYQRCLVPADGFYEWKKTPDNSRKIPYYSHLKHEEIFSFVCPLSSYAKMRKHGSILTKPPPKNSNPFSTPTLTMR